MTKPEHASQNRRSVAMIVVAIVNVLILGALYDHFCWPPDDGHYAHVAERILDGEILHRDIEDFHTDNSHAINVAALALFGRDLRSLRIPLVAVTFAQSLLLFWVFRTRSSRTAGIAAVALSSLSFVQYLNPQPHWYCLMLAVAMVALLTPPRPRSFGRLMLLGALVGTTFLFRQLTGVLLGMGVVAYLLVECPDSSGREEGGFCGRALLVLMAVAEMGYLTRATDLTGFLLFGIWPVILLLWAAVRSRASDREVSRILAGIVGGALLAGAPTVLYHSMHGSLAGWIRDCLLSALEVEALPYLSVHRYAHFVSTAFDQLLYWREPTTILNSLYWLLLPLFGVLNGMFLLNHLRHDPALKSGGVALPFIAAFYGPIALFNQIPMYLYYAIGLLVAGVLWTRSADIPSRGSLWEPVVVAVSLVALVFHAGQPATRTLMDVVAGVRIPLVTNARVPRASLWLEARVIDIYGELVESIHRETGPGDPIFVLPNHPEVYFLANRKNPFWFPNTSLALHSLSELERVLQMLRDAPPALVIHAPRDRHNTDRSEAIMEAVSDGYDRIAVIGEFVVYRKRDPVASAHIASAHVARAHPPAIRY